MPIYCVKVQIAQIMRCSETDFGIISQRIETSFQVRTYRLFVSEIIPEIVTIVSVTTISGGLIKYVGMLLFH